MGRQQGLIQNSLLKKCPTPTPQTSEMRIQTALCAEQISGKDS